MAVDAQAKVGLQINPNGMETVLRSGKDGGQITAAGQGQYYEATANGRVFSLTLTTGATAISAGNLNGAAAGASTQFALWNPVGSGKNLSLLKFAVAYISGTTPVTGMYHSFSSLCPTIVTTVSNPIQCNLTGAAAACVARGLAHTTGSALTGSAILQIIRQADLAFSAGTFAALGGYHAIEYIDGDIVIGPGTAWVPTWKAAGTNTLVDYSITWQETEI
jgi:hypothetical protein